MAHLLGTTHLDRFTVQDGEGTLITGASFDADQVYAPDGNTFTWSVTEISLGMYQVQWQLDQVGTYYLRLVTDDVPGFPFQVYEFEDLTDDLEVGEEVRHYFTVLDDDGQFYGGCPISVDLAVDPGGAAFVPIIIDLANGLYRVTWPTTGAGVYTLRLLADLSGIGDDPQRFEFETRVYAPVTTTSAILPIYGSSLDDLVRSVALLCRDLIRLRATDDSVGADAAKLWLDRNTMAAKSPKTFKGANLFVTLASADVNVGVETLVIDSTTQGLNLAVGLPAPPRRGDEGYLTNLESTGFLRQSYVDEINDQVANAYPLHLVPAVWTFTDDPFDADAPFLTPPQEMTHIYGVSYPTQGYEPNSTHIPYEDKDRAGWYWDNASGRVVISGGYREVAMGAPMTLRGYGREPRMDSATDQTSVSRKWLTEMAAGALIISTRDARRMAEGQNHVNRADAWLPELITMVEPGTVKIR